MVIRHFEIDGTRQTASGKRAAANGTPDQGIIGTPRKLNPESGRLDGEPQGYRLMFDMAETYRDAGKNLLNSMNVFASPTIGGMRIAQDFDNKTQLYTGSGVNWQKVQDFLETHNRLPMRGDRISFVSHSDINAPVDRNAGQGAYVVKTGEADELFPGTKDCVVEYTICRDIEFEATAEVVSIAQDAELGNLN